MDALLYDVRLAARGLRSRPAFTLVAVLSIALGIGFNTAVFSAVNALMIRPVAGVDDADRAVEIGRTSRGGGFDTWTYPDFLDLRERLVSIDRIGAWRDVPLSLGTEEGGSRLTGMAVSAGYFAALGATAARGRVFGPEEDRRTTAPVAVISHRFWRERLAGDPDVVGRTIDLNRTRFTVIGVTEPRFEGHIPIYHVSVWVPIALMNVAEPTFDTSYYDHRGASWFHMIGRLAPGATIDRADAEVRAVMTSLAATHPATNAERGGRVVALGPVPGAGRGFVSVFLGVLSALVGLVLIVAAANVAGMLLARAVAREKEVAIRLAIGSGRGRLVRQLVTESLLLFLLGAAGGVALAWWGTGLVSVVPLPGPAPVVLDLSPDLTVMAFALALALATGVGFGLLPALQATRPDLVSALKDETRSGRRGGRMRRAFARVQVGLSVVLLVAAGLFGRALMRTGAISPGFDPADVQVASLDLSLDGYDRDATVPFQDRLLERLRATPGVDAVALADDLPMDLSENATPVVPEGYEDADGHVVGSDFTVVSAGFFDALRIPVVRGRAITDSDRAGGALVVVINQALARQVWGSADPVGRRLRWGDADGELRTVVGVAADVKNQTLGETVDGMVYLPHTQHPAPDAYVVVRGATLTAAQLRRELLAVDARLSIGPIQPLAAMTAVGLLPQRIAAAVAGGLGVLALFLSAMGVYGVIAFSVTQRRREIGVRMAIGATRHSVVGLVVRGGLRLALPGILAGAALALAVSRVVRGLLFGVSPFDPLTFVGVAVVLTAAVLFASWLPARRAASTDPAEALGSD